MFQLFLLLLLNIGSLFLVGCQAVKPPESETVISPSPAVAPTPPKPSAEEVKAASEYRQLGLEYRSQKRYPEAIEALSKSVNLDPYNLSGGVIYGWTLHLAGKQPEAIAALQKTLSLDPNHVPALNALGIVYLVSGNLPLAVETHHQAIKLKPANEIAHYNLSLAYHRLKNYDQGIIHGQEATVLEADNPHPWVSLALIYWDKGDKSLAQQTYQKAIALDGRYRERWFLDHLKEAGFTVEQIDTVEAIRQYQ
ncbi:Tetratricopeptide TPR_2 repeat protein [Gloeothece citriformis PCC 7424]|uniref:Tetratricopeptide TPR_2 repeat protein n=1 Tax=Gloeothece citriformis (strain PCC 7424) TaxID=65393 RepID=B7KHI8_GLOC7|nr:tetratricopeptide repeat protein [Gloeothece citriformis]ACK70683.1 Tetratricopeptide TPR_2 repeat protein [Gloeothece citriformis PCC 7424]